MNRRPRLFIGSSVEGLAIADAVNVNLDHSVEVTIWRNGTFDLASTALDSLVAKASTVDFSLFIFSPDDLAVIRSERKAVVRDNVLFELGLFTGAIGKERSFIIKPRNVDLHFPTDLIGVITADYESERSDGDLASAVNHACVRVKGQIEKLGLRQSLPTPQPITRIKVRKERELTDVDYGVMGALLCTLTEYPRGLSIANVKNGTRIQSASVDLSAIRLERMGFIERRNEQDNDGYDYFSYLLTEEGVEELLENEDRLPAQKRARPQRPAAFADDDIPF